MLQAENQHSPTTPDISTARSWAHLRISKGDKGKGAEGLWDEDVHHLSKLAEVGAKVLRRHILCASSHKHLSVHKLLSVLLQPEILGT